MAVADTVPSALPYVAWSSASFATIPLDQWDRVFGFMQALKGHVQEYPGCQRFEAFAEPGDSGMRIHVYTTWDTPQQLEAYVARGYTFERMLADAAEGLTVETTRLMEKIF